MVRIDVDWIGAPSAQAIFTALEDGGYRAFFVGGCVRDAVVGRPVSDLDIATDAVPEEVMRLATAAGLRPVPTGIDHGTITVVAEHHGYEVTTFRRDVETDGRRAVVAFSKDKLDDARRRDFTMNALYADREGLVFDPLGSGLHDLKAGRVRFIEDASDRIREDYLRILRFFRFHAWYGDARAGIDPEALAAIAALAEGIEGLSRERIGHELVRLLGAPDPSPSLAAMQASGVLARALPGAVATFAAPLVYCETAMGLAPDPMTRLAALGGENAADALRLSRTDLRRLDTLRAAATGTAGAGELGYRLGAEDGLRAVALRTAMSGNPLDGAAARDVAAGAEQVFPVRAEDLMPELQGSALGARLKRLEQAWIASGFALDRDALLRLS